MGGQMRRKYQRGEGARYVSREAALRTLQLTLKDFRKLCILKGVYPREPRNRKKAQKGAGGVKTLYHKKDIQFLMHEPIIWKFRDIKVFAKKCSRAYGMKDFAALRDLTEKHPTYNLDRIVKERFPTFIDAIRDLDDCLTLLFLFSTFPSMHHVPRSQSALCRRLTVEFLHAVIAAKALRKVFISIKGYYFQAEIKGQTVTWIVPHHFGFQPQEKTEVDFRTMSIFVHFYTIMLGFVNFRLYHSLNLFYPPKLAGYSVEENDKLLVDEEIFVSERIAALNINLCRAGSAPEEEEEADVDLFQTEDDPEQLETVKQEAEKIKRLKTLFKGKKFFLNREVPREPLVFIIRCFGGEVSWDKLLFVGATFDESDETITHQIVDRPIIEKQYISRYYVQPQWVFDCVNARQLVPAEKYFIGVPLPPHLSPFETETREHYIPPEEIALKNPEAVSATKANGEQEEEEEEVDTESEVEEEEGQKKDKESMEDVDREKEDEENVDDEENEDEENVDDEENEDESMDDSDESVEASSGDEDGMGEEALNEVEDEDLKDKARLEKKKQMAVNAGTVTREDPDAKLQQEREEYKLREKMIRRKYRNLYKDMMEHKRKRVREVRLLEKKRKVYDEKEKAKLKAEKKQRAMAAVANAV